MLRQHIVGAASDAIKRKERKSRGEPQKKSCLGFTTVPRFEHHATTTLPRLMRTTVPSLI